MAAVGDAERAAHAEAALGEVEAVAHRPADPVVGHPANERGVDAALQHQVLDQPSDVVVGERGDDRGPQPEAATQTARDVVLAAALPDAEGAGGADAPFAGIEAQHHLAERDEVVAARSGAANRERAHGRACATIATASAASFAMPAKSLLRRSDGCDHPAAARRQRLSCTAR